MQTRAKLSSLDRAKADLAVWEAREATAKKKADELRERVKHLEYDEIVDMVKSSGVTIETLRNVIRQAKAGETAEAAAHGEQEETAETAPKEEGMAALNAEIKDEPVAAPEEKVQDAPEAAAAPEGEGKDNAEPDGADKPESSAEAEPAKVPEDEPEADESPPNPGGGDSESDDEFYAKFPELSPHKKGRK